MPRRGLLLFEATIAVAAVASSAAFVRMACSRDFPEPLEFMIAASAWMISMGGAGNVIALRKHRRWFEGFLLGALLGPIGLTIEAILPGERNRSGADPCTSRG
jgi:hypothetical protein